MIRRSWHLARQLRAERWPVARQRARQLAGLKSLVRVAYAEVPFYRALMAGAGVRPADLETLADLGRLPLVDKAMLRAAPETHRVAQSRRHAAGAVRIATSGSQGAPFEFLVDRRYNAWRKAQYLRPYVTNGRRPGQRLLRMTTRHAIRDVSWPVRAGLLPERRVDCAASGAELFAALDDYRPEIVQGYPSSLRVLAHEMRRRGGTAPSVVCVFSDSEVLTQGTRRFVEAAFGAPVLDVYGTFEADNMAYECNLKRGFHVATDSVIAEIVDAAGRAVPDGGSGELVVTILHNRLMPFIRYRTGDLARLLPEACPCGRTFPLLELCGGRRYDLLALPDGGRVSALGLVGSFNDAAAEIVEFRIIQTAPDTLRVQLVPASPSDREAVERRATERVRAHIPGARVEVEFVERVPRTAAGKLLAFTSEAATE